MTRITPNMRGEAEFVARARLTPGEIAWVQAQPVIGSPNLRRLRSALEEAGFADFHLKLSADRQFVQFFFRAKADLCRTRYDLVYARLLRTLRASGFGIGFEELALDFYGEFGEGGFLVAPLAEICGS